MRFISDSVPLVAPVIGRWTVLWTVLEGPARHRRRGHRLAVSLRDVERPTLKGGLG